MARPDLPQFPPPDLKNPQAFGEFYEKYSGPVQGYFYKRIREEELARDLTGETFLNAFEACQDPDRGPRQNASGWIFRIAHNLLADHFKLKARRPTVPLMEEFVDEYNGRREQVVQFVTRDERVLGLKLDPEFIEMRDRLRKVMPQLSQDELTVIEERFFEGKSQAETAKEMGKTESGLKVAQFRAVRRLGVLMGVEREPANGSTPPDVAAFLDQYKAASRLPVDSLGNVLWYEMRSWPQDVIQRIIEDEIRVIHGLANGMKFRDLLENYLPDFYYLVKDFYDGGTRRLGRMYARLETEKVDNSSKIPVFEAN